MPKQAKEFGAVTMPRDLPMPKYEYQKPSNDTFSYSFGEKSGSAEKAEEHSDFSLQNVKLAI